jgi:hypothetical protein
MKAVSLLSAPVMGQAARLVAIAHLFAPEHCREIRR